MKPDEFTHDEIEDVISAHIAKLDTKITELEAELDTKIAKLDAALNEAKAKAVYNLWSNQESWVPWVYGGNSDRQDEARKIAVAKEANNGAT